MRNELYHARNKKKPPLLPSPTVKTANENFYRRDAIAMPAEMQFRFANCLHASPRPFRLLETEIRARRHFLARPIYDPFLVRFEKDRA